MSPRERAALLSAVAAVAAVAAAGSVLLALDLKTYLWIQQYRPSDVRVITRLLDLGVQVALATVIAATVLADPRQLSRLVTMAPLVASGAFLSELLKTALERLRPSALPGLETGNSLPSGHIMNTTLFAVVAWDLAGAAMPPRWRRVARAVTVAAVAMQATARVLRGSHWPSDVAPSILIGIAWMLGAGALWRTRWTRAPLVAAALAAYVFFWTVPSARLHLPSVLDRSSPALMTWHRDTSARPLVAPLPSAASDDVEIRTATVPDRPVI